MRKLVAKRLRKAVARHPWKLRAKYYTHLKQLWNSTPWNERRALKAKLG